MIAFLKVEPAGSWFWQAQLAGSWFWQLLPLAGLFCPFPPLGLAPTSSTWVKTQTNNKEYGNKTPFDWLLELVGTFLPICVRQSIWDELKSE